MNEYYTYAYLRKDRTPYYIGKGKEYRAYFKCKGEIQPPKDKSRIIFLKQNLTEEESFRHEIYMIAVLGRKDLGTGILRNRTNGGEGASGIVISEETRRKLSEINKGKILTEETKRKMSESKKGKNHPTYNKTISQETRQKLSESHKGEKNHFYSKKHSPETREKMKLAWKKRKNEEKV